MPQQFTYPGVYVQEVTSQHVIQATSTSVTAFVGYTQRGPDNTPVRITSFVDFERAFGPCTHDTQLPFSISHFFTNGGTEAIIVRTPPRYTDPQAIRFFTITCGDPASGILTFTSICSGDWPNTQLTLACDTTGPNGFRITIRSSDSVSIETFTNLSLDSASPRFIATILNDPNTGSQFMRVTTNFPAQLPDPATLFAQPQTTLASTPDGASGTTELIGDRAEKTGIFALLPVDDISLLCLPDSTRPDPTNSANPDPAIDTAAILTAAIALCEERSIFLLIDPPVNAASVSHAEQWIAPLSSSTRNAAAYFPRIIANNPLYTPHTSTPATLTFAPCGFVAGVYARTDATRGIWKAPAGTYATLPGVLDLTVHLTDADNAVLNPLAVNALRTFPIYGPVIWGARTLVGADSGSDPEFRYVSVRRLGLHLERSIQVGTQWVVFEPNTEPTWAFVRSSIENFLLGFFRSGAFQGPKPEDAYFVHCGLNQTMTDLDVQQGRLIIEIGFAPTRPAEFIILRITQLTGQTN